MKRESSTESSSSTLSNITVGNAQPSSSTRSSLGPRSTPPTSVDEPASQLIDASKPASLAEETSDRRRSVRSSRNSILSYNINALSGTARSSTTCNINEDLDNVKDRATENEPGRANKSIRLGNIRNAARATISLTKSMLGKRGRENAGAGRGRADKAAAARRKSLRPRTKPTDEPAVQEEPVSKRVRPSTLAANTSTEAQEQAVISAPPKKVKKIYLAKGLYAGQTRDFDPRLTESKNKRKRGQSSVNTPFKENRILPLPMFMGEKLLSVGSMGRDFKLPWGIVQPLPKAVKVEGWTKVSKNRAVGDAIAEWKKQKPKNQYHSVCLCDLEDGCGLGCLNRGMFYECDSSNCALGPELCKNRPFAELEKRVKSNNMYDIGVEVFKTAEKGHGIRSMRCFDGGQLIMEYTGEIITQEECDRRVNEDYKDNECYYLMTFQRMIIDATKGSMARFVNHSCEPNCKMDMWTVGGRPRMALFAGRDIELGEELTYDYNFEAFSSKWSQTCRCGTPSCRGVLGPRGKEPVKPKEPKLQAKQPSKSLKRKADDRASNKEGASPAKRPRLPFNSARARVVKIKAAASRKAISVTTKAGAARISVSVAARNRIIAAKPLKRLGVGLKSRTAALRKGSLGAGRTARQPAKANVAANRKAVKPLARTARGAVRSIRGPRRSEAAAKMGIAGARKQTTLRVVNGVLS